MRHALIIKDGKKGGSVFMEPTTAKKSNSKGALKDKTGSSSSSSSSSAAAGAGAGEEDGEDSAIFTPEQIAQNVKAYEQLF